MSSYHISSYACNVKDNSRDSGFCSFLIILALVFTVLLSFTVIIDAESTYAENSSVETFTEGCIKYRITSGMNVEVTGCSNLKELVIPSSVTYLGDNYSVTSISCSAFKNNHSLTSVTISDSVTSVGDSAFKGCSHLNLLIIGKSVTSIGCNAFCDCISIKSVTIPDSVKSIGENAFNGCRSLTTVTIGNGTTSIGKSVFLTCGSLENINVSKGNSCYCSEKGVLFDKDKTRLIKYPANKLEESYVIPDSVISIGDSAFYQCQSLKSVTIPDSVTSIGDSAFYQCTSLTTTIIGDGVTSIGESAFNGCAALTFIIIPSSVKSIGGHAFSCCTFYDIDGKTKIKDYHKLPGHAYSGESSKKLIRLDNVRFDENGGSAKVEGMFIKEGKKFILPQYTGTKEDYFFFGWSYGEKVYSAGDSVTKGNVDMKFTAVWETTKFRVGGIDYEMTSETTVKITGCVRSEDIVLSSSVLHATREYHVTSIGDSAFKGCTLIASVIIPDSVISVGESAFEGCISLTSVTFGKCVSSLGGSAFAGCTSLTSVIGLNVKSIGNSVFRDCTSLTSVTVGDGVASIDDYAFCRCTSLASATLGRCVTFIGSYAFKDCTSLASVTIPDSAASLGDNIFSGCKSLTTVTLGKCIAPITRFTFSECGSLGKIDVSEENSNYSSVNGVLFNKDGSALILYPMGKIDQSYYIPDNVRSIADHAFCDCTHLRSLIIGNGITSITEGLFKGCTFLVSVEIGNSVRSICDGAFYQCTSLKSVTISDSVTSIGCYAFYGCTSLQFVTIPCNVTSIGESAFKGCTSLSLVIIPCSVKSIGSYAFDGCTFYDFDGKTMIKSYNDLAGYTYSGESSSKLIRLCNVHFNEDGGSEKVKGMFIKEGEKITLPEYTGTKKGLIFAGWSYSGDTYLPGNEVTKASGDVVFTAVWAKLTFTLDGIDYKVALDKTAAVTGCDRSKTGDIAIPSSIKHYGMDFSVVSINESAFEGCISLTSVTIGNSVLHIGNDAFAGCTSLKSVTFGELNKSIGYYAFAGCTSLMSLTIGGGVTFIDESTFCNCTSLTSVVIPDSVTHLGNGAFRGCKSLTSVIIGNGITSIENCLFRDCTSLTTVAIPVYVKSIGDSAFDGCTSLTSMRIGNGVTSIGSCAFFECKSLTLVSIPKCVKSIGAYAFEGCKFYSSDGKTKIGNYSKLPGYKYVGESSSKLIRHDLCNVFFDVNGGSVGIEGLDIKDGDKFTIPSYTGTKIDYTFDGWSYDGKVYKAGDTVTKVSGDMRFIAVWVSSTSTDDGINCRIISDTEVGVTVSDGFKTEDPIIPLSILCHAEQTVLYLSGDSAFGLVCH